MRSAAGYLSVRAISQSFDAAINQTQPVLTALPQIRFQAAAIAFTAATPSDAAKGAAHEHGDIEASIGHLNSTVAEYRGLVEKFFPTEAPEADRAIC